MSITGVIADTVMITGFVLVMMLIVEYLNVVSAGVLQERMRHGSVVSYLGAGALGTVPGCLGSFAAVTLYVHGALPLGALVANTIATSGDEAFVMLALFPDRAVLLFAILLVYGIVVGALTDRLAGRPAYAGARCPSGLTVHANEGSALTRSLLRPGALAGCSLQRASLCVSLGLFLLGVATGAVGPMEWSWIRISLLGLGAIAFWIVFSVPEHFLEEHLWRHVAREHVPRLFLWVGSVLLILEALEATNLPITEVIRHHPALALLAAVLVGIIPESGPHLIIVTLFAQGALPFSVLLGSSVVQDGHGMLPLLAESPREFIRVKAVNIVAGLGLGAVAMALGA